MGAWSATNSDAILRAFGKGFAEAHLPLSLRRLLAIAFTLGIVAGAILAFVVVTVITHF